MEKQLRGGGVISSQVVGIGMVTCQFQTGAFEILVDGVLHTRRKTFESFRFRLFRLVGNNTAFDKKATYDSDPIQESELPAGSSRKQFLIYKLMRVQLAVLRGYEYDITEPLNDIVEEAEVFNRNWK